MEKIKEVIAYLPGGVSASRDSPALQIYDNKLELFKMDLKELERRLANARDEIEKQTKHDIPLIVGREAVNHYQEGFQKEGFTDTSLIKWQEVKRRMANSKARGADRDRKILTGKTGALHDSIDFETSPGKVTVYANPQNKGAGHNYAQVHQFGTATAGRKKNVVIPARPIIGRSEALMKNINARITRYFEDIIKNLMR